MMLIKNILLTLGGKMINIIKLLAELFRLISNLINFMIIIIKNKKK